MSLEPVVDAENPWPGLAAFREVDQEFFHGRRSKTEELLHRVLRERLTILFGLSGLGKTSLLQAGLFPRLPGENILPVPIRLDYSESRRPLVEQIRHAITQAATNAGIEVPPAHPGETLWESFHRQRSEYWSPRNRRVTPLLVFDQFEEIFTLGQQDAARARETGVLLAELGSLCEGTPPPAVLARLDADPSEVGAFTFDRHPYKILLSLREDFLPDLEALRDRIGAIAHNRMRLLGMNGENALQVVSQEGRLHLVDPQTAERIVRFVASEDAEDVPLSKLDVEPALLSFVCQELNSKRQRQRASQITADLLQGTRETIFVDFYERSIADLDPQVRSFIEERLLTKSGYRNSEALEDALETPGITLETIKSLTDRRLLRIEGLGRVPRVELTHDVLTGAIRTSRDTRRQREAQAKAEAARHEAEARERQARRGLRRSRIAIVALGILLLGVFDLTMRAWKAEGRARLAQASADIETALYFQESEPSKALVYLARATETFPENLEARSLLFDFLLRRGWALPIAVVKHEADVLDVQFSPDGLRFLTASRDGTARVWDSQTGRRLGTLSPRGVILSARFSPDGRRIAITTTSGHMATLWNAETFQPMGLPMQHENLVRSVRFSPDGTLLVTTSNDATAGIWDAFTGEPRGEPLRARGTVYSAEFSPDGNFVVTRSEISSTYEDSEGEFSYEDPGKEVAVWDLRERTRAAWSFSLEELSLKGYAEFNPKDPSRILATFGSVAAMWDFRTGERIGEALFHKRDITSAHFSPDGKRVVTTSEDGTAQLWDAGSGEPLEDAQVMLHGDQVTSAEWSRDGLFLVTTSMDKTARLWHGKTGQPLSEPMVHDNPVTAAAIDPSNRLVVTASEDNTARVWNAQKGAAVPAVLWSASGFSKPTVSTSGDQVATVDQEDKEAQVWSIRTGTRVGNLIRTENPIDAFDFSLNDDQLAVYQYKHWDHGLTQFWDLRTFKPVAGVPSDDRPLISFAFSRDGKKFATGSTGNHARVWSTTTGKPITPWLWHPSEVGNDSVMVEDVAFSPDGEMIATSTEDGKVYLWDARSGRAVGAPLIHTGESTQKVPTVEFSPDGRRILSASWDYTARLWNWQTGKELCKFPHHEPVYTAHFSPDGRQVVTASWDKRSIVWDAESCRPLGQPMTHQDRVLSAEFNRDGTSVLTLSEDNQARVWDAQTGKPLVGPLLHRSSILSARFSADRQQVITVTSDGIFAWDVPAGTPEDAELLARIAEAVAGFKVDEHGIMVPLEDPIATLSGLRRETADASPGPTAPWLVHWFLADRWERRVSPLSRITVPELIRRSLAGGTDKTRQEAERAFPGHPRLSPPPPG